MSSQKKPSYFTLCQEEPFRIFFPLGVLVGLSGVSLWPLFFSGMHKFYPGIMHARMMIEGFMGAFILGFLGTAMPRLTEAPHLSRAELRTLLGLYAAVIGLQIGEQPFYGDLLFLGLLLFFAARMGARFSRRKSLPPPSFVLVAFGFFNAIAGTALLLAGALGNGNPRCAILGALLLYQGFVVYLLLGIGGFLFGRFLNPLPAADSPALPARWKERAIFAAIIGLVLLATFFMEVFAFEWTRAAGVVRFVAAAAFLLTAFPVHRSGAPGLTMAWSLRTGLALLVLGLLFPVLWPGQRVAGLHVVFIGGFSLITFTVATRVVLGHCGASALFESRLLFLILTALLLVAGMGLRVAGDFLLAQRSSLLTQASYLWMLATAIWSWRLLPKVRIADSE